MDVLCEREGDRLLAVRRFGDDLAVGLGVEDRLQPSQHDRVVVGDEDSSLQWSRHGVPESRGIESFTSVP